MMFCTALAQLASLHSLVLAGAAEARSFSPVIGVLSQPPAYGNHDRGTSHILASYVKWLEAVGARVVPIEFDMPESEMTEVVGKLNGVLYPGGGTPYEPGTPYGDASIRIWKAAQETNMPVWATCLGFEQVMFYSGANMTRTNAENLLLPLNFTNKAFDEGSLFAGWPTKLREAVGTRPLTANMHHWGVTTAEFSRKLQSTWNLLATGTDRNGTEFVAAAQYNGKPFYATQFHPEKNIFEFSEPYDTLDGSSPVHSGEGIELAFRMATFFVDAARAFRGFGFEKEEFERLSIYGHNPVYMARDFNETAEQGYFFPMRKVMDESLPSVMV